MSGFLLYKTPVIIYCRAALRYKVDYTTTLNGAFATCQAHLADPTAEQATVSSVQELHKRITG